MNDSSLQTDSRTPMRRAGSEAHSCKGICAFAACDMRLESLMSSVSIFKSDGNAPSAHDLVLIMVVLKPQAAALSICLLTSVFAISIPSNPQIPGADVSSGGSTLLPARYVGPKPNRKPRRKKYPTAEDFALPAHLTSPSHLPSLALKLASCSTAVRHCLSCTFTTSSCGYCIAWPWSLGMELS